MKSIRLSLTHRLLAWQEQEQATLKPMVEGIRNNLGENIFDRTVLTEDTGFSSEANMQYIFVEKINAVIPDPLFRVRDPVFADSEQYSAHKAKRKKTRKDKTKTNAAIPSFEFTVNLETNTCICPTGKELVFLGD